METKQWADSISQKDKEIEHLARVNYKLAWALSVMVALAVLETLIIASLV